MNKLSIRTLITALALSTAAVSGIAAGSAHADALPGLRPAAAYSNGCSGPPFTALLNQSPPLVDPTTGFPFFLPFPRVFVVNFVPACDMHDAGYSGGFVIDPITGRAVDTSTQSRFTIDVKFWQDLKTLCMRTIPWDAPVALGTCFAIADTYFTAVRAAGSLAFDASPFVPGRQMTGTRPNN